MGFASQRSICSTVSSIANAAGVRFRSTPSANRSTMSRKFFAIPWTLLIIASATSGFGIMSLGMRTGRAACRPKIGSTPNSSSRASSTSAFRRPSKISMSRVIVFWADRASGGIDSARAANSRRRRRSSSSPARLTSSNLSACS